MSDFIKDAFLCFCSGISIGAALILFVFQDASEREWETKTVDRGLAIYCPKSGEWAWVGECDE